MVQSWRSWNWQLGLVSCLVMSGVLSPIASLGDCALAQITPDLTNIIEVSEPAANSAVRSKRGVPAWLSERWMFIDIRQLNAPPGCAAVGENEFIITGRGGLPPSPNDALSSDAIQVDWVTLNPGAENYSSPTVSTNPTAPAPAPLVEAQGWVINDKGEVVLTATAPNVTSNIPWMTPATCHGSATFHQQTLALSKP